MRETPAQRYETGRNGTRGEAGHPAHNPKVAGSNPAPATNFAVLEVFERAEEKGGVEPPGDELVFVKPDGSWVHPHSFSQVLDRKVAKLDVSTISLHDLRHTHATLLLKARVPAMSSRSSGVVPPLAEVTDARIDLRTWCVRNGHGLGAKDHEADRWIAAVALSSRLSLAGCAGGCLSGEADLPRVVR